MKMSTEMPIHSIPLEDSHHLLRVNHTQREVTECHNTRTASHNTQLRSNTSFFGFLSRDYPVLKNSYTHTTVTSKALLWIIRDKIHPLGEYVESIPAIHNEVLLTTLTKTGSWVPIDEYWVISQESSDSSWVYSHDSQERRTSGKIDFKTFSHTHWIFWYSRCNNQRDIMCCLCLKRRMSFEESTDVHSYFLNKQSKQN